MAGPRAYPDGDGVGGHPGGGPPVPGGAGPGAGGQRGVPDEKASISDTRNPSRAGTVTFDLATATVRELNAELHAPTATAYRVLSPSGAHALAAGVAAPVTVDIMGPAGYYAAGMNDGGTITVHGTVATGVAENMMSGTVRVTGNASQSAGATGHGGLLVIEGSASMRCGISMKGI